MKKYALFPLFIMACCFSLFSQVTSNSPLCSGDDLVFTITENGISYTVLDPEGVFNEYSIRTIVIPANQVKNGTYVVGIVRAAGDTIKTNLNIVLTTTPDRPTVSGSKSFCVGDQLDLMGFSSNNPDEYRWMLNDGTTLVQNPLDITATTALGSSVKVSASKNGCESTQFIYNFTVNTPPTAKPVITGLKNPYCEGDDLALNVTNAGSFVVTWQFPDGSSQKIRSLNTNATLPLSGMHLISFSQNSCEGESTVVNVTVNETPEKPNLISNKNIFCTGDTLILYSDVDASFSRMWTLPKGNTLLTDSIVNFNIQSQDSGIYALAIGNMGCFSDTTSINIETTQSPILLSAFTNAPICEGDSLVLYTKWDFSGTTTIKDTLGFSFTGDSLKVDNQIRIKDYQLIVSNDNGCESQIDTIITPVIEKIRMGDITGNSPVCEGGILSLRGLAHDSAIYIWKGPAGYNDTIFDATFRNVQLENAGRYTLRYENMCDTLVTTFDAVVNPKPVFDIVGDSSVCEDENEIARFGVEPANFQRYTWNTGESTRNISVENSDTYFVDVENEFGCIVRDEIDIPTLCFPRYFSPNAFTPNGDGTNDVFFVRSHNLERVTLQIFNFLGEKIFETGNLDEGWDGTYQGLPAREGRYVYIIDYETIFKGEVRTEQELSYFFLIR